VRNIAKMALLTENRNRDNQYSGTYNVDIGTYNGGEMRRRDSRGRYAEGDDGPEMRRRRDSRGRYMEMDDGPEMRSYNGDMPESRFRDRRGREHYDNGRFAPMRNEGGESPEMRSEYEPESRHGRYAEAEESPEMRRGNVYPMPRRGGMIGFASSGGYSEGKHRMGRSEGGEMEFDHETAKEWTKKMKNADGSSGPHWQMEQVKPFMAQAGFSGNPLEFWAVMNALYSDYCAVAKKFGVDRPEYYAALAKAWLEDEDAVPDKAAAYYECIVQH